jgi:hypothetical protein
MSREDPLMRFRAPPDLKKQIEDSAWMNRRSVNAEIVARLEASFAYEEKTHTSLDDVMARLAVIEEAIKEGGKK